jgi:hypothetical protein
MKKGQGFRQGANLRRYSIELIKAFTISALTKFPLKALSLSNQNFQPV